MATLTPTHSRIVKAGIVQGSLPCECSKNSHRLKVCDASAGRLPGSRLALPCHSCSPDYFWSHSEGTASWTTRRFRRRSTQASERASFGTFPPSARTCAITMRKFATSGAYRAVNNNIGASSFRSWSSFDRKEETEQCRTTSHQATQVAREITQATTSIRQARIRRGYGWRSCYLQRFRSSLSSCRANQCPKPARQLQRSPVRTKPIHHHDWTGGRRLATAFSSWAFIRVSAPC